MQAASGTSGNKETLGQLAFKSLGDNGFRFDTGMLSGNLGPPGKGNGLSTMVHISSGIALDRGANGHGIFSHYRVFGNHQRYGHGAWDWPKDTRLLEDGAVELQWRTSAERPFVMRAVYRWLSPDALDLTTEVVPESKLAAFEVFLASYFAEAFSNALVYARDTAELANVPDFAVADEAHGVWQMFPRDTAALQLISDGRWQLPPNPVEWTIRPRLEAPIAMRRVPGSGLTVVQMAMPTDCFAIAMPHETEGHYSVYFSLGGKDLYPEHIYRFRTHLWVAQRPLDSQVLDHYHAWVASNR